MFPSPSHHQNKAQHHTLPPHDSTTTYLKKGATASIYSMSSSLSHPQYRVHHTEHDRNGLHLNELMKDHQDEGKPDPVGGGGGSGGERRRGSEWEEDEEEGEVE